MSLPHFLRAVAILTLAMTCLLPTSGCGGGKTKKKTGLTIEQRLAKARQEPTREKQARELVKVARLRARSGDKSGTAQTLSEARSLLRQPEPEPPRKSAGEDAATEPKPDDDAAARDDAAAAGEEKPADGQTVPPDDAATEPERPAKPEIVIDPTGAGPTLVEIAAVYALIGERTTAKDVLSQAEELLPKIDDVTIRIAMLADAGGIYGSKSAGLGNSAKAGRTLEQAAKLAAQVEERFRPEWLAAVAMGYVNAELATDADKTVAELEELARKAEDRSKVEGLAVAATVRGKTDDMDAAKKLLAEASEAAKAITSPENRAYALLAVVRATDGLGDRKAALNLLKTAEKAAQKVGDPDSQKTALEKVRTLQGELERRR